MTGRGRPRKAESPGNKCATSKTRPKEEKGEKHNGATKEQEEKEQKKTRGKQKGSAQNPPKETEVPSKLQRTPDHNAPVEGTKDKTKAKSTAPSVEETKMHPKTTKASSKTIQAKTCDDETKPQAQFAQQKDTKTKTCAGKDASPVKTTEDTAKTQPQMPKQDRAAVDSILYATLDNLKIKRNDRSHAAEAINEIKKYIVQHLKENTLCFKDVGELLGTGSYYENVKISNPDEFDVMVPIPVERVKIEPFREDGAFYSVALKRGNGPLQKFQEKDILSASKMLSEFREEVKKCVRKFTEWTVTKKEKGCPAVTLTRDVQSVTISLDVVLCLMVRSSWPPFTKEGLKIEAWLGRKVKQEYKRKPYYLVPKYEGRGTEKRDGVFTKDVWRISFSHIEKAILMNHGSEKTCCEKEGERCCRKDCLKLLKHLLSLLKENNSSFDKFCSYHAKTTMLHTCCSRTRDSDWKESNLSQCFELFVENFIGYLEKGVLNNFFIPDQNLLSAADQKLRISLACCIKKELDEGFPIFKYRISNQDVLTT